MMQHDKEEQAHFNRIIKSFKLYDFQAQKRIAKVLSDFNELPKRHKDLLFDFEDNCKLVNECVQKNGRIIELILEDVEGMFEEKFGADVVVKKKNDDDCDIHMNSDVDRVSTTLRQIVRDWSEEGESERDACYGVILKEIKLLFPEINSDLRILVPGSGLGRMAFEIAKLGFYCEGNEISMHMLIASNFIINKCYEMDEHTIYPYALNFSNNYKFSDQTRGIHFPDTSVYEEDKPLHFNITAGDWLGIYQKSCNWNGIVTCFFIDTAHNVVEYLEKIWEILKPGGVWINFGPLLYHYSNVPGEKSLEISYEQIKRIAQEIGFKYLKEDLGVESKYVSNEMSMMKFSYDCVFTVLQKPE